MEIGINYQQELKNLNPNEEDLWFNLIQQIKYLKKLQGDDVITSTIQDVIKQKYKEETLIKLAEKLIGIRFNHLGELAIFLVNNSEELFREAIEARGNGKALF
ncbi:MAG: hypothetical protein KatS3mg091_588 [Patescibacteria group bacterium]|nr:MAG: hypothetical protein KatS3mg091_588 [Patescibacteria group bacterium]